MSLVPYDPFRHMENWRQEVERWLSEQPFTGGFPALRMPRMDVYETENEVIVSAELPGLEKKDDVQIDVDEDRLTISGSVQRTQEVQGGTDAPAGTLHRPVSADGHPAVPGQVGSGEGDVPQRNPGGAHPQGCDSQPTEGGRRIPLKRQQPYWRNPCCARTGKIDTALPERGFSPTPEGASGRMCIARMPVARLLPPPRKGRFYSTHSFTRSRCFSNHCRTACSGLSVSSMFFISSPRVLSSISHRSIHWITSGCSCLKPFRVT